MAPSSRRVRERPGRLLPGYCRMSIFNVASRLRASAFPSAAAFVYHRRATSRSGSNPAIWIVRKKSGSYVCPNSNAASATPLLAKRVKINRAAAMSFAFTSALARSKYARSEGPILDGFELSSFAEIRSCAASQSASRFFSSYVCDDGACARATLASTLGIKATAAKRGSTDSLGFMAATSLGGLKRHGCKWS